MPEGAGDEQETQATGTRRKSCVTPTGQTNAVFPAVTDWRPINDDHAAASADRGDAESDGGGEDSARP